MGLVPLNILIDSREFARQVPLHPLPPRLLLLRDLAILVEGVAISCSDLGNVSSSVEGLALVATVSGIGALPLSTPLT